MSKFYVAAFPFRAVLWLLASIAIFLLVAFCGGTAAHAAGVGPCLPFDQVKATLAAKYKEVPVAVGLLNDAAVTVLFSQPFGESWTLVVQGADGNTCFLASGSSWVSQTLAPAGEEG